MDNCTPKTQTKQLAMIVKTGPAFSLDEIDRCHTALDQVNVPRELDGYPLSLSNRLHCLLGRLSARDTYTTILENVYQNGGR